MEHTDPSSTGYVITALCTVITFLLVWTLSELRGIKKDIKRVEDKQNMVDLRCTGHANDTNRNTRDIHELKGLMRPTRYDLARAVARLDLIDHRGGEIEHVNIE